MIIKQCQFAGRDDRGDYVHLVHPGYANQELIKTADVIPDQLRVINAFFETYTKRPRCTYLLLTAMGASEYWGDNSNGDRFPEASLIHKPPNWDQLSYPDQVRRGKTWAWGFPTFYNAHPFAHHLNSDPKRAYGSVIYALWDDRMKRVLLIVEVDHEKCRQFGAMDILDRILNGEFIDVSMGTRVPFDVCVPPETRISTKQGLKRIDEIIVGDQVLTHKGRFRKVTNLFSRLAYSLYEIRSAGSHVPLRCTANHPVLILPREVLRSCHGSASGLKRRHIADVTGSHCTYCNCPLELTPIWVEADSVRVGDYVTAPLPHEDQTISVGTDWARIVGYYLGDGFPIRQRAGRKRTGDYKVMGLAVSCNSSRIEHALRVMVTLVDYGVQNEPNVYSEGDDKAAISIRVYDQELGKRLISECGERSRGKHLPSRFWCWEREERLNLLGALIDTDGSQDKEKGSIRYSSVCESLIFEIQQLCYSLQIPASVHREVSRSGYGGDTEVFSLFISKGFSECLSSYSDRVEFFRTDRRGNNTFFASGYLFSPVKEIREIEGEQKVLNLAVEEDESYVAEGRAVHNCSVCGEWDRVMGYHPQKVLADHKKKAIRGLAVTKEQYCQHIKFELGRILPNGTKVAMVNLHPRMFDISFVHIGADKTSKVLAKLAGKCPIRTDSPMCKSGCFDSCIPSSHVHAVWEKSKMAYEFPSNMAQAEDVLDRVLSISPRAQMVKGLSKSVLEEAQKLPGVLAGQTKQSATFPGFDQALAEEREKAASWIRNPWITGAAGTAVGGGLGYLLAPEDKKMQGATLGASIGGGLGSGVSLGMRGGVKRQLQHLSDLQAIKKIDLEAKSLLADKHLGDAANSLLRDPLGSRRAIAFKNAEIEARHAKLRPGELIAPTVDKVTDRSLLLPGIAGGISGGGLSAAMTLPFIMEDKDSASKDEKEKSASWVKNPLITGAAGTAIGGGLGHLLAPEGSKTQGMLLGAGIGAGAGAGVSLGVLSGAKQRLQQLKRLKDLHTADQLDLVMRESMVADRIAKLRNAPSKDLIEHMMLEASEQEAKFIAQELKLLGPFSDKVPNSGLPMFQGISSGLGGSVIGGAAAAPLAMMAGSKQKKTASVIDTALDLVFSKAAQAKMADQEKKSEIIKQVRSNFADNLENLTDQEPDLDDDVISEIAKDVPNGLASAGSLGVILKPREFQKTILIASGKPDLADELDDQNICFSPQTDRPSPSFHMGRSVIPRVLEMIAPLIGARSAMAPALHRRVITISISSPHESPHHSLDNPVLDKLSCDYAAYRQHLLGGMAKLAANAIASCPSVLTHLFPDVVNQFGMGLVKEGQGVVQFFGMLPTEYLCRAYLNTPVISHRAV